MYRVKKILVIDIPNKTVHEQWKIANKLLKKYPEHVLIVADMLTMPYKGSLTDKDISEWKSTLKELAHTVIEQV